MTSLITPTGSLRGPFFLVARHPVPTMVTAMLAVAFALLVPPALAGWALEPFLLATVVLAQLVPSVLVTAAVDGRAGVRDLFRRSSAGACIRPGTPWRSWRCPWRRCSARPSRSARPPRCTPSSPTRPWCTAYLAQLAILPLINLWEETAVMGVIQARLTATRGPLVAAVLTGLVFGFYHLPLRLGQPLGELLIGMAFTLVLAVALRVVAGWLYARTGGSILLVAALHATYNAVNNTTLLTATAPGSMLLALTASIVVIIWAVGLLVATGGRLSTLLT